MNDVIHNPSRFKAGWQGGLPETPCGYGARLSTTTTQREWIPDIISKYAIYTIADIGAGDLNWISKMDLRGAEYTAYDLVPRHPKIIKFDLTKEIPPQVDLIMCLWVLNHLPYDHCKKAIENIKASGSKYLMVTDRLKCRDEQPPEIDMVYVQSLRLNGKGDSIRLIPL